ncbi:hypothetical protein E4M02_01585 [Brevundimonas sp. S30B]|uniref:DUF2231 domain-containing protein n=1 Tax=unclassified Brevundimonas TaxID=2622653 RepID=UPI0010716CA6|nr:MULTISPECIES: DUF2231 domain-containing protein [unclassified Brevundimonas]QBX37406.1 hypothetical protein E4M01_06235 [Brevundimonas sp. MF30-B]TFW03801.1 hypothetical protein E4M02_01585 [Brevundimonas sp. S30B]
MAARTPYAPGIGRALHGILLAFPIALFTSAIASDVAYLNTGEMQWTNFSSWLIAGGLLFAGLVLLWAIADAVRSRKTGGLTRSLIYLIILIIMFVLGFINALHHSRDAWSSVGAVGLTLSILTALLAVAAGWVLHTRPVRSEVM